MLQIPIIKYMLKQKTILVLSAHCDDAPIGCGGLLLRLKEENKSNCRIVSVVFSGGNDEVRKKEEEDASKAFGMELYSVFSFPDTGLPNYWYEIKSKLIRLRDELGTENIGAVICPLREDQHQDHRIVAENAWRIFRNHMILEYELQKYEGDLSKPNLYVEIPKKIAEKKIHILMECYKSRSVHNWWKEKNFEALMSVRGMEINKDFAEGLTVRKILI